MPSRTASAKLGWTGVVVNDEDAIEAVCPSVWRGAVYRDRHRLRWGGNLSAVDVIDSDDEVVVINTGARTKSADLLCEEWDPDRDCVRFEGC